jgi:hypothetical protein
MFQFLFKYFSNTDSTTSTSTNNNNSSTTATSSSRESPFNIHYRTAYKKCWIDKIKK